MSDTIIDAHWTCAGCGALVPWAEATHACPGIRTADAPRPLSPEERALAAIVRVRDETPASNQDLWAKVTMEIATRAAALVAAWRRDGRT